MKIIRRTGLVSLLTLCAALTAHERASATTRGFDFNGDGKGDFAVGSEWIERVGAVYLYKGNGTGYDAVRRIDQAWLPDDGIEPDDYFGKALAWGDFNGDGAADLVMGAPYEDLTTPDVGAIHVYYDKPFIAQFFTLQSPGLCGSAPDCATGTGNFGRSLAAGDFNRDGVDDLAVGAQSSDGGRVYILYGQAGVGLQMSLSHFLNLERTGMIVQSNANFGSALAAGDLDCDGDEDLAIGVPYMNLPNATEAGAVVVAYAGGSFGLWDRADSWTQNGGATSSGSLGDIQDVPEGGDHFGAALAIGNFNGDTILNRACNDLAVGVPKEDVGTQTNAGAIQIIKGSSAGLKASGNQLFHQDVRDMEGTAEANDLFGAALAASNIGSDAVDDLIVGVPGEDSNVGAIQLMLGQQDVGLTDAFNKILMQSSSGVPGTDESDPLFGGDQFGIAVGAVPFADVLVGVPNEQSLDPNKISHDGWVAQLRMGFSGGFTVLSGNTKNVIDFGESLTDWARFGMAITAPRPGR